MAFDFSEYAEFEQQYTVEDCRRDLGTVVQWFRERDYHQFAMEVCLVKERKLPIEVGDMLDLFWVDEDLPLGALPDWMKSDSLGVVRGKNIVQMGRLVYPVKDVYGNVAGFVGWDPFVQPKYLDSRNYGYKAKRTMLMGMEKMYEYYTSDEPVYLVEGVVCMAYLRSKGFNALAALGSFLTPYVLVMLRRFGRRLIVIPDCDAAGDKFVRQCKFKLIQATIVQPKYGKDVDGCRKEEDGKYEEQLLKDLVGLKNPFYRTIVFIRR